MSVNTMAKIIKTVSHSEGCALRRSHLLAANIMYHFRKDLPYLPYH